MSFIRPTNTETLLDFELSTTPDPPQASPKTGKPRTLTLTFVANAPGDSEVNCTKVKIEFDVAQGADECLDSTFLSCGGTNLGFQADSKAWIRLTDDPYGTATFVRPTGVDPDVGADGYTFEIDNIPVSPVVGTAQVTVTETSWADDPSTSTDRTATFDVAKFPPQFKPVEFELVEADPTIDPGGFVHLRWQEDPSATYALSWDRHAPVPVKGRSPWKTPQLTETTTFTLTVAYQEGGHKVQRHYYLTINVRKLTLSISADHQKIHSGETAKLFLEIRNAKNCVLNGGPRPVPIDPKTIVDGYAPVSVTPSKTTDYVLGGDDIFGHSHQSDKFTVKVLPKAPSAKADLVFIKTANTNGNAELHVCDGARRFQEAFVEMTTGFPAALGPLGRWTMAHFWVTGDPFGPKHDLIYVKTADTGSDFPQPSISSVQAPAWPDKVFAPYTPSPPRFLGEPRVKLDRATKGVWLVVPMVAHLHASVPELVFIQTTDTASGYVEVYTDNRAVWGYSVEDTGPWTTMYPISNGSNGTWRLADMTGAGTLPPDLVFIQTAETDSGKVEVSYATGASGYTTRGAKWVTDVDTDSAGDGTWHLADMSGDGRPDLVFVKTANTDSGQVEIYYATQADRYRNPIGGATRFPVTEGPNGTWEVVKYS
jgi:hypothetical protein